MPKTPGYFQFSVEHYTKENEYYLVLFISKLLYWNSLVKIMNTSQSKNIHIPV